MNPCLSRGPSSHSVRRQAPCWHSWSALSRSSIERAGAKTFLPRSLHVLDLPYSPKLLFCAPWLLVLQGSSCAPRWRASPGPLEDLPARPRRRDLPSARTLRPPVHPWRTPGDPCPRPWHLSALHSSRRRWRSSAMLRRAQARSGRPSTPCFGGNSPWVPDPLSSWFGGQGKASMPYNSVRQHGQAFPVRHPGPCRTSVSGDVLPLELSISEARWC